MSNTIIANFLEVVRDFSQRPALGFYSQGHYQTISYQELNNLRSQLADDWQKKGYIQGEKVAVMLPNCPEWVTADLASATLGLVVVPVHYTYPEKYLETVVNHSGAKYLLINQELFTKYKNSILSLPLKAIYVVGLTQSVDDQRVLAWPAFDKHELINIESVSQADDLHTIVYTSGTTGEPKGVMLSHKNLVSDAQSARRNVPIHETDKFFSFLPLSHAFERMAGYYSPLFAGCSIYYAQSAKTMIADIKLVQPTVLPCVPRIFEKIYEKIFTQLKSGSPFKKKLFYKTLNLVDIKRKRKLNFLENIQYKILDQLVLKKIRNILGGQLRLAISGGASLNPAIAKFFVNLGLKLIEGYGLTEASPIAAVNHPDNYKFGTVGLPLDCNQIKLSPDKEILIKGDNVMLGYYANEQASVEAFDEEGWLHTGDLGFFDNDGFLSIVGRAKDVIVLSTGKNIFPEPIESQLNINKYISQSMVYGDKQKALSALIVADAGELKKWCEKANIAFQWPHILSNSSVINLYRQVIDESLKDSSKIEGISTFKLIGEDFSIENGLLTITMKLRRRHILRKYFN